MRRAWFCIGQTPSAANMFKLFQKSPADAPQSSVSTLAEQTFITEALLSAAETLIGSPQPETAARSFCEGIVNASPNICLAWVWFGDPRVEVMQPQIAIGQAMANVSAPFMVDAELLFPAGAPPPGGLRTQTSELSTNSMHASIREAASRYGARSMLIAPISRDVDERGLVAFYATRPKYFETMGVGLFDSVARLLHTVLAHARNNAQRTPAKASDSVTGLVNRRHCRQWLEHEWRTQSEHVTRGLLLMLDLDSFSGINERFGHIVADLALKQVAQTLLSNVRKSDMVARWDDTKFLVWLPGMSAVVASATAEKLHATISQLPVPSSDTDGDTVNASLGATPVAASDTFTTALDRVERALESAKHYGQRSGVVVARPGG